MAEAKSGAKKAEIEDKKKQFLEGQKQAAKKDPGPPLYLLALLLVLGILGGYALSIVLAPPVQPADNGNPDTNGSANDLAYRTVPITIVYSDECKSCRQTNTIEELFMVRQIPYVITKVEAGSEEGQRIIDRLGIKSVPTAVIDAQKLEFYPSTKANFDGTSTIRKSGSAYIVPELNLNENFYYPVYFLSPIGGFCASGKNKIVKFDDFYGEESIEGQEAFFNFVKDYNASFEMKFSFAQTISSDENAVMANLFLMCASQQGAYLNLNEQMTGIYCNNTPGLGDESVLTRTEIAGCSTLSSHYGTALEQVELDKASARANLDLNSLATCVSEREVLLNNAERQFNELNAYKIPGGGLFLIDCAETTALSNLEDAYCARHPEVEACGSIQTGQG